MYLTVSEVLLGYFTDIGEYFSKLGATLDILTRDNIHQYQCNDPFIV